MVLLIALRFSANVLEINPVDKRVAPLRHQIGAGACTYVPNHTSEYQTFLKSLEKLLENVPAGNPIILLQDLNAHVGKDHETWRDVIGRKGLPRCELK